MKFLKIFGTVIKHIGTVKKVSDTLVLLIEHMEDIVPKIRDIWSDDFLNLENSKSES